MTVALTVDNAVVPNSAAPPFLHSARLVASAGAATIEAAFLSMTGNGANRT